MIAELKSDMGAEPANVCGTSTLHGASSACAASRRILSKVNTMMMMADATPTSVLNARELHDIHAMSPVASVSAESSNQLPSSPLICQKPAAHRETRRRYWPAGAKPEQTGRRCDIQTSGHAIGGRTPAVSSRAIGSAIGDRRSAVSSCSVGAAIGEKSPVVSSRSNGSPAITKRSPAVTSCSVSMPGPSNYNFMDMRSTTFPGSCPKTKEACGRALLSAALRLCIEEGTLNSLSKQAGLADANGECNFSIATVNALRVQCGVESVQDLHGLPESKILTLVNISEDEKARLGRLCAYLKQKLPYEELASAQLPVKKTFIHFKREYTNELEGNDRSAALRDSAPAQMESSQFHTKDVFSNESEFVGLKIDD